jgi:hypothetical protein
MGIDIYAKWNNQTDSDREAQAADWLTTDGGRIGYLREAYHGEPYATRHLFAEVFESDVGQAYIAAETLHERLERTLELVEERERTLYKASAGDIERVKQSYRDFVALCERKERETGEPVLIIGSY